MSDEPLRLRPGEFLVPRSSLARSSSCRACGKPIVWTVTATGARMPLARETARSGPCPACAGRGRPCASCESSGTAYALLNHWADCPAARRFRRDRGVGEPGPTE